MTSLLKNQKCILTKENTRRRCFRLRKNNEADKTSDPIQSNPIQSMDESNPCPTMKQRLSVILRGHVGIKQLTDTQ